MTGLTHHFKSKLVFLEKKPVIQNKVMKKKNIKYDSYIYYCKNAIIS